jgi:hypothetical protein
VPPCRLASRFCRFLRGTFRNCAIAFIAARAYGGSEISIELREELNSVMPAYRQNQPNNPSDRPSTGPASSGDSKKSAPHLKAQTKRRPQKERAQPKTANDEPISLGPPLQLSSRPQLARPFSSAKIEPFLSAEGSDLIKQKRNLSVLDRKLLNRVTLPLVGTSNTERAQAAEQDRTNAEDSNEVSDTAEATSLVDPEKAREYKRLIDQARLDRAR